MTVESEIVTTSEILKSSAPITNVRTADLLERLWFRHVAVNLRKSLSKTSNL